MSWRGIAVRLAIVAAPVLFLAASNARVIQIRANSASSSNVPQGTMITFKDGTGIDITRSGFQITFAINASEAWTAVATSARTAIHDSLGVVRPTLISLNTADSTLTAQKATIIALASEATLRNTGDSTLTAQKATIIALASEATLRNTGDSTLTAEKATTIALASEATLRNSGDSTRVVEIAEANVLRNSGDSTLTVAIALANTTRNSGDSTLTADKTTAAIAQHLADSTAIAKADSVKLIWYSGWLKARIDSIAIAKGDSIHGG